MPLELLRKPQMNFHEILVRGRSWDKTHPAKFLNEIKENVFILHDYSTTSLLFTRWWQHYNADDTDDEPNFNTLS